MHDNVINNAFFAILALGAGYAGLQGLGQVMFAPQTLEVGTTFGRFVTLSVLGV